MMYGYANEITEQTPRNSECVRFPPSGAESAAGNKRPASAEIDSRTRMAGPGKDSAISHSDFQRCFPLLVSFIHFVLTCLQLAGAQEQAFVQTDYRELRHMVDGAPLQGSDAQTFGASLPNDLNKEIVGNLSHIPRCRHALGAGSVEIGGCGVRTRFICMAREAAAA
ncbi:hypothetical protein Bbelb_151010 [Branchiostoma belcheri]|nr:hypothetical protein Bbelb_151010 [Branchiostoma belcheri]